MKKLILGLAVFFAIFIYGLLMVGIGISTQARVFRVSRCTITDNELDIITRCMRYHGVDVAEKRNGIWMFWRDGEWLRLVNERCR